LQGSGSDPFLVGDESEKVVEEGRGEGSGGEGEIPLLSDIRFVGWSEVERGGEGEGLLPRGGRYERSELVQRACR
jgi:hypothetical protein